MRLSQPLLVCRANGRVGLQDALALVLLLLVLTVLSCILLGCLNHQHEQVEPIQLVLAVIIGGCCRGCWLRWACWPTCVLHGGAFLLLLLLRLLLLLAVEVRCRCLVAAVIAARWGVL